MEEIKTKLAEVVHREDACKYKWAVDMFNLFKKSIDDLWVDGPHHGESRNYFVKSEENDDIVNFVATQGDSRYHFISPRGVGGPAGGHMEP